MFSTQNQIEPELSKIKCMKVGYKPTSQTGAKCTWNGFFLENFTLLFIQIASQALTCTKACGWINSPIFVWTALLTYLIYSLLQPGSSNTASVSLSVQYVPQSTIKEHYSDNVILLIIQ